MVVTEDQVGALIKSLTETVEEVKRMQAENTKVYEENSRLQHQMIEMLREKNGDAGLAGSLKQRNGDEADGSILNQSMSVRARPFKCKPTRPKVETELSDLEWQIFVDGWNRYKRLTELADEGELCLELRECCSTDVNKLLYEYRKDELSKADLSEDELLNFIKEVSVKTIHPEVHRWHFTLKSQEAGEAITRYVGRLKAQAALCNFSMRCKCNRSVNYAEAMITQQMVAGLSNPEHQSKVMSEAQDLPDLRSKINRLVSLETTEDATSEIRAQSQSPIKAAAARFSQYKKGKRFQSPEKKWKPTPPHKKDDQNDDQKRQRLRCRGCGRSNHGEGKSMSRDECPAFGKECLVCHKRNHFAKVCDKRDSRSNYVRVDGDTTASDSESEEESGTEYYFHSFIHS